MSIPWFGETTRHIKLSHKVRNEFLAPEEANIGVITLNRPDVLNVLNLELLTELDSLLEEIKKDKKIRTVPHQIS